MMEASPGSAEDLQRAQRRHGWWALGWLTFLGLAIYELTAQPALGVAIVCLKFGWEDFRTAWWLRRVDPERRRGRACFWLYLASGLWRTAILGTILMFAICWAIAPARLQQQNVPGQVPTEFSAAVVTAMGGFILSTLATCIALAKAWRGRIKLWLNSSVHEARRLGLWPPPNSSVVQTNYATRLVLTALLTIVPFFFPCAFGIVLLLNNIMPAAVVPACIASVVSMAFGILVLRETLSRGFAICPSECWGHTPRLAIANDP